MSAGTKRNARWDVSGGDIPRHLFPTGRIRISFADRDAKRAAKRRALCEELRADQEWEILHGMVSGRISIAEVERRIAEGGRGAYREIVRDLERHRMGATPTLADEIADYCAWYKRTRKIRSYENVKSRLKRLREQVRTKDGRTVELGSLPIDQIRIEDLENALLAISDHLTTQENVRVAASGMLSWSIERESERAGQEQREPRWYRNPAKLVASREKKVRVVVLSEEEVIRLLRHAEPYQVAYLRAFLHLGLRHGELCHTRLGEDLDLRRWLWEIQDHPKDDRCTCSPCRTNGWSPKNANAYRKLHVPSEPRALRESIERYLSLYPAEYGDYVFRNPRTGAPWVEKSLQEDFKALCDRAGVAYGRDVREGAVLHSLRHTCATQLLRAGVEITYAADLLGDTIETIKKTYVHLDAHDLGTAVRKGPSYDL